MSSGLLVSFLVAALVVQVVPGPGMLFILAQGMSGGPRAGVAAAFGAAGGMVVHTCAAALGLAAAFSHAPAAYDAVRVIGAAYLLWLAACHFRASGSLATEPARASTRPRRVFVRSWLNNLANPKVIVFYVAFLPQFVDRGGGPVAAQLLALGAMFLLIGLVIDIGIGIFAGRVGEFLLRRASLRRIVERVVGTILGGLGVRLLASSR